MFDSLHRLWDLTLSFGEIGVVSLGGGNSMIKLIQDECVSHRGWLTTADFNSLVGMTFLFPGLTACKIAGMIGLRVAGIPGLLVAALAINLPGIVLTAGGFSVLLAYRDVPLVKKLLEAMQWGAMALIAAALFDMMRPHFEKSISWLAVALTVALFCSMEFAGVSAVLSLFLFLGAYMVLPL